MIDDLVKRLRKKLKSADASVEITTVWDMDTELMIIYN